MVLIDSQLNSNQKTAKIFVLFVAFLYTVPLGFGKINKHIKKDQQNQFAKQSFCKILSSTLILIKKYLTTAFQGTYHDGFFYKGQNRIYFGFWSVSNNLCNS